MSIALIKPAFATADEYAAVFTDTMYWQPYITAICARHGLSAEQPIETGLPGTNPVFLLDGRYVVKLYPPFFNGADSYARELDSYTILSSNPALPVPQLIGQGQLFDDEWRWPYIITTWIAGDSYGAAQTQLLDAERARIAGWLGTFSQHLHALPLLPLAALAPSWDAFAEFIGRRRAACEADNRRWQTLPDHLIAQIDTYIPPLDELIDRTHAPCFIHADLNADHLLGQWRGGSWQPSGVIDFGDAQIGDQHYELIALHFGLFRGDKRLLERFLASYGDGLERRDGFVRRAMSYTLLHEFNILAAIQPSLDAAQPIRDLDQLAQMLWAIDAPAM